MNTLSEEQNKRFEEFWKKNYGNPHFVAVESFLADELARERKDFEREIKEVYGDLIAKNYDHALRIIEALLEYLSPDPLISKAAEKNQEE